MSDDAERYGPQLDDLHEEELRRIHDEATKSSAEAIDDLHEEELRNLRAEGSSAKPPKPTGNACKFCNPVPIRVPMPTGRMRTVGMKHAHDCTRYPDERISAKAYVGSGRRNPTPWRDQ